MYQVPEGCIVSEKVIAFGIGDTRQLCENNPRRKVLILVSNASTIVVGTQPATLGPHGAGALAGGVLIAATAPFVLNWLLHPGMVTQGWFGATNGGSGDVVTVIEAIQP